MMELPRDVKFYVNDGKCDCCKNVKDKIYKWYPRTLTWYTTKLLYCEACLEHFNSNPPQCPNFEDTEEKH